jgi:hypothetical protein
MNDQGKTGKAVSATALPEAKVLGTLVIKLKNGKERSITLRSRRFRGVPVLESKDTDAHGKRDDLWAVFEVDDYPEAVELLPFVDDNLLDDYPSDRDVAGSYVGPRDQRIRAARAAIVRALEQVNRAYKLTPTEAIAVVLSAASDFRPPLCPREGT